MADEIVLTAEQEKLVLDTFSKNKTPPSITQLVKIVFPDIPEADGRSKYGRAIKVVLAVKGVKARTTTEYAPKDKVLLNDSQKEFCKNNCNAMTPVEMARTLFNNQNINNLNLETRAIHEYLKTVEVYTSTPETDELATEIYRPPKSSAGVLQKVDKYVFNHGIDKDAMTAQQKAGLEALLSYLNTFRFVNQINLYENQNSRSLFESSFVRYTYDKPDLTEEEVDQYINVSHDNVSLAATHTRMERLQGLMEENTNNNADERARISMSLVESIKNLNDEYNQTAKRQQALLGDLKEKRSDRIAQLRSANASILNLVQLWKEEKSRKKLLHLADARKQLLAKTVNELSELSEVKAMILGLNPEELINS